MSGIISSAGSKSGIIGFTEPDFEEGDWVPVFQTNYTSWLTVTFTGGTQIFKYVKIGKLCSIFFHISGGSASTPSIPEARITGYPFASSLRVSGPPLLCHSGGIDFSTNCAMTVDANGQAGGIMSYGGAGYNWPNVSNSGTSYIHATLTYPTIT